MNICFNVYAVGLANNGGSRTLIRCAETLNSLGHYAFFHSGKSRYTWHKHAVQLVAGKDHPKCDVTIATGYNSWKTVAAYRSALQCYYVRGLELWKTQESNLIKSFTAIPNIFVNSVWLQTYMRDNGISAHLQYPGLDTDLFFVNQDTGRAGVGSLMHNKHKTKRSKDALDIASRLDEKMLFLNKDIKSPNPSALNKWYNGLKVWFAPTELEGLHNPPIEASLAGCALVCTDHPRSGMQDYAIHEQTALVYPSRNLDKAVEYVNRLLSDDKLRKELNSNMLKLLSDKFGSRASQMTQFVSKLTAIKENK